MLILLEEKESPIENHQPKVEILPKEEVSPKVETSNEEDVDFSKVFNKAKDFFSNKEGSLNNLKNKAKKLFSKKEEERKEDEISFDLQKFTKLAKKNANWLIPLCFILIAILVSTHFRMIPSDLPITDDWARNGVNNFYRNQIENSINQQYPNLPPRNKEALLQEELQKALEENKEGYQNNVNQLSQQYKSNFQDENGDTYLLAIDPYLWYSQARNVVNHGHLGDVKIEGKSYFSLRDGRLNKESTLQLNPYVAAYLYKFLSIFSNISLMRALFLLPVFLIGLSLIPAFFIGRKIAGNVGGLFAAIFLAINPPLLGRTPGGFADTDAYSIVLPLFIAWFVLEAYAAKETWKKIAFGSLSGLFVGLYAVAWTWSHMFSFVIGALIITFLIKLGLSLYKNNFKFKASTLKEIEFKPILNTALSFLLSTALFVTLFKGPKAFFGFAGRLLRFVNIKEVGVKTIWPNVLTTVAEFNTTSFSNLIGQLGGNLFFFMAVLGVILTLVKLHKDSKREYIYFSLLTLWLIGTAYAFTKGSRFAILMAPPFAIALGSTFGFAINRGGDWLNKGIKLDKIVSKLLIFGILALFLISPFATTQTIAKQQVPSMDDTWYNLLTKIKDDSRKSIITSWWDFGHWFVAIAERSVTFDGGDQGQRIHWVGRTLQTDSEKESIGTLRMLNCVQELAPNKLDSFTGDSLRSIKIIKEVLPISDRETAKAKYQELGLSKEQAEVMLDFTHCQDLLPNYYITSQDMIGKAGVWGHFGSWDFNKASMYQNTIKLTRPKAIEYLQKNFGLSESEADRIHQEIQTSKADSWIASWPGYIGGIQPCSRAEENLLQCETSLQGGRLAFEINLQDMDVSLVANTEVKPDSLVYATKTDIIEKKFEGPSTGFSIILLPNGENYQFLLADPLQANSIFTRLFFYEGHGLKCFSKFDDSTQLTGGKIITWKVDYSCQQENKIYFLPEPEVRASHILITTSGRSEEEALMLVKQIQEELTTTNFDELAKEYSEDPGSALNGGELGWFKKGVMVPEFEEAAFSLGKGEISEPIKTQFGYHLILVEDKKTE